MTRQGRGAAQVVLAGCLWGFNGLFVSALTERGVTPLGVALLRFGLAGVLLVPAVWRAGRVAGQGLLRAITPRQLLVCCAMGSLTNGLACAASCVSTVELGMTEATVLEYTAPVFGCAIARLLYGERLCARKLAACALNFLGVVLVVGLVGPGSQGFASVRGVAFGLANALLYALAAPLGRLVADECHPLAIVFWQMAAAALVAASVGAAAPSSYRPPAM